MKRVFFVLLVLIGVIFADENLSNDLSILQERIATLEEENTRLKAQLEGNVANRRSSVSLRGDDLSKDDACKCHYCSETDNPIKSDACTECDGYCDLCDFCESNPPLIAQAKCTTECGGGGYTSANAPAPEVCVNPLVSCNAATICEPLWVSTDNSLISDYVPKEALNNVYRWFGFSVKPGYTATLRAIYLYGRWKPGGVAGQAIPIHGGLYSAPYGQRYPGNTAANKIKKFNDWSLTDADTVRNYHKMEPEGGHLTLNGGVSGMNYFLLWVDRWPAGNAGATKANWYYQKTKANMITVPDGIEVVIGRRTINVAQTTNWDAIPSGSLNPSGGSDTENYLAILDISATNV